MKASGGVITATIAKYTIQLRKVRIPHESERAGVPKALVYDVVVVIQRAVGPLDYPRSLQTARNRPWTRPPTPPYTADKRGDAAIMMRFMVVAKRGKAI